MSYSLVCHNLISWLPYQQAHNSGCPHGNVLSVSYTHYRTSHLNRMFSLPSLPLVISWQVKEKAKGWRRLLNAIMSIKHYSDHDIAFGSHASSLPISKFICNIPCLASREHSGERCMEGRKKIPQTTDTQNPHRETEKGRSRDSHGGNILDLPLLTD